MTLLSTVGVDTGSLNYIMIFIPSLRTSIPTKNLLMFFKSSKWSAGLYFSVFERIGDAITIEMYCLGRYLEFELARIVFTKTSWEELQAFFSRTGFSAFMEQYFMNCWIVSAFGFYEQYQTCSYN